MPREFYYPDVKEPHIHSFKNGAVFTDVGHNHRTLYKGSLVYQGVVNEVVQDLLGRGDDRSRQIANWIQDNV